MIKFRNMPITFFCGEEFPEHEYDQFKRMKNILIDKFKGSNENVYLFYNFSIGTKSGWQAQIDMMLLRRNKMIIMEMKDCDGKIVGSENDQEWIMIKDDGSTTGCKKNFFSQCGRHRGTLIEKIRELREEEKLDMDGSDSQYLRDERELNKMISSWICLRGSGHYAGDININEKPWFYVTNENELRDTIDRARGRYSISDTFKESLKVAFNLKDSIYSKDSYYFMENRIDELLNIDENQNLSLEIFRKEVENQNLNFEKVEEIIFRSALGGIYTRNEILKGSEKEEKYLVGFGYIKEIRKYDRYSVYYYLITDRSKEIADTIIRKRILNHKREIIDLIKNVGINAFMISLLGEEGSLNGDPFNWEKENEYVLSQTIEKENRNLISENLLGLVQQIFESDLFQPQREKIFERLYEVGLCNKDGIYNSSKQYTYEFYRAPINYLLKTIDIESWVNSIDEAKMKEYLKWKLIAETKGEIAENKKLFDKFEIVIDKPLYDGFINMFNLGILSKPMNENNLKIVIYDQGKLQKYCEDKMQNVLKQLIHKY